MIRQLQGDPAIADGLRSLRLCVSAGEPLPLPTFSAWREATGLEILDSLGTTELLNAVLHAVPGDVRPGSTGKPVPGYEVMVVDEQFRPVPPGQVGRLAVRGATGCLYLDDPRQGCYVQQGWNLTGDAFHVDEDGFFWYHARTDDLIVSAGYKISGLEVENVLMEHEAVQECAVIAAPDRVRGSIPKAFVVIREGMRPDDALAEALQCYVKDHIAPYKYPRAVEFLDALPRTETGKIQRFKLRRLAWEHGEDD
jgi:2-aminobenzoate-CoA ligase